MAEVDTRADTVGWYNSAVANETEKPIGPRAKLGRRVAQILYFAIAGFMSVASVVQLTRHVFFPAAAETPQFGSCRDGLRALYQAIERGRIAAERGQDEDEEAALLRYRAAVAPDWSHRDSVAQQCSGDPMEISALDAIERLRYSEEHSVRHQAVELSALRQKVKELVTRDRAR